MKILVTGGCGFVGANICLNLKNNNHSVYSIDNLVRKSSKINRNILKKKNIKNYNKSGKIYVSNLGKFFQTLLCIFEFLILLVMKRKGHDRQNEHHIIREEINLNERI